jgi:hypothetical protein
MDVQHRQLGQRCLEALRDVENDYFLMPFELKFIE